MGLRITIHHISIDGLWGSLTPKRKTADFTPFLWITKEDFRFGWYKAMLLGFSRGRSTDADETKETEGPFLWPYPVRAETCWKEVACAFGDVRNDLRSTAHAATEQREIFLQGPRKVAWTNVYRLQKPLSCNCSEKEPLFKGWGEWEKCKIKIQTSLSFCTSLKPVFPIDQTTLHNAVQRRQTPRPDASPLNATGAHSQSNSQTHACISHSEQDWRKYVAHEKAGRLISGGRMLWKDKVIGVTTVDGPDLLTQSPGNLRQCSKRWSRKVLFFNMRGKWEGILTGRQPETIRTRTTKYLQDCTAVKWKCSVQNRVDNYLPGKRAPVSSRTFS